MRKIKIIVQITMMRKNLVHLKLQITILTFIVHLFKFHQALKDFFELMKEKK